MNEIFEYHVGDRTVRVTASDGQKISAEQAQVVAFVKIGDELAAIARKLSRLNSSSG